MTTMKIHQKQSLNLSVSTFQCMIFKTKICYGLNVYHEKIPNSLHVHSCLYALKKKLPKTKVIKIHTTSIGNVLYPNITKTKLPRGDLAEGITYNPDIFCFCNWPLKNRRLKCKSLTMDTWSKRTQLLI